MPTFAVPGVATPTDITLANVGPIVGNIDPAGGVSAANVTLSVTITVPSGASAPTVCTITPITFPASTANAGGSPFTGTPQVGTATAAGFTVPAVVGLGLATPPCNDAEAAAINGNLGLPTTSTSVTMTLSLASPLPVVAGPRFTG